MKYTQQIAAGCINRFKCAFVVMGMISGLVFMTIAIS